LSHTNLLPIGAQIQFLLEFNMLEHAGPDNKLPSLIYCFKVNKHLLKDIAYNTGDGFNNISLAKGETGMRDGDVYRIDHTCVRK
jgi:hypothetical protein